MVYDDTMHRTQIYLDDEEVELLERTSRSSGASRSELIRRAVRALYGASSAEGRLAALRASAGSWGPSADTGVGYVDRLREGLDQRLRENGLE